jgi:hypothetical protein
MTTPMVISMDLDTPTPKRRSIENDAMQSDRKKAAIGGGLIGATKLRSHALRLKDPMRHKI